MFYYKNELKTQTENEKQNKEYNSNRIQTTKNLHLPESNCELKDSVWKKMWPNNRSFPMNFKTLGYTQVQCERERLVVGNECESCDIFIRGKKKWIIDEWNKWMISGFLFEEIIKRCFWRLSQFHKSLTQFALLVVGNKTWEFEILSLTLPQPTLLSASPSFISFPNWDLRQWDLIET